MAGMNVFEFLALVMLTGGLAWGILAAAERGFGAAVLGGLLGAGKAYLIWILIMFSILVPLSLGLLYRPMFPRCRKGKCRDRNFRIEFAETPATGFEAKLQQEHQGMLVRCACGDVYLRSNRDRKFYEVREDGTLAPFMKYRLAGRWQTDSE